MRAPVPATMSPSLAASRSSTPFWENPAFRNFAGNALTDLGYGLTRGHDISSGLAHATQRTAEMQPTRDAYATQQKAEQERQAQLNQTVQFLQEKHPDLAAMVESGMPVGEAWGEALKRMQPGYGEAGGGDESFFGNIVPMQDENGNVVLGQASNRGNWQPLQGAEGMSPAPTTKTVDIGNFIITQDVYGNELYRTPKSGGVPTDYQPAGDGSIMPMPGGPTATGAAEASGAKIAAGEQTIAIIDKMIGNEETGVPVHPGLDETFGRVGFIPQQMTPAYPGTHKADFQALREQLQGKAFLEAYTMLKGGGPITDIEGTKAEQAMVRMQAAQSKEAFIEAMQEFRDAVASGMAKLQAHAQGGGQAAPAPAGGGSRTTSTGVTYTVGQ